MVGSPVHGPVARLETARVRAPPTERGVWRENIRRSKEGGSARWPSIVHSHVGMQAMADVKVSLPRSAPHACETHAAFVPSLGARSAICMRLVLRMCSRFWQESALHVALGGFIRDRDRRFYRITIVEVSDLIVIAHPPWRSLERQARPRGRHGQRHARPGNLSGNVTRPGPHGWSPRPAPYSSRSHVGRSAPWHEPARLYRTLFVDTRRVFTATPP